MAGLAEVVVVVLTVEVEWEVVVVAVVVFVVAAVDAGVSLTGSLDDSGAGADGGFSLSFSSLF